MSERPVLEVADVFRCPEVKAQVAGMSAVRQRVVRALTACRTASLGGHVDTCDQCGHQQISYNSCRNRHCPKCQGGATGAWVEAQQAHLLPVPYCHVTFTLPRALAPAVLQNHRLLYGFLFKAASEALLEVARDPKHLGARIGVLAILHTWGQTLQLHPHVHCLVPAGGPALDGKEWIACRPGFFLPVRVLSRLYRGKYLRLVEKALAEGKLRLWSGFDQGSVHALLEELRHREWVVHARPPVQGPDAVVKYLARYTHRVAISNQRLRRLEDGEVSFEWKDYATGQKQRVMTLTVTEFARRFLLHVLPPRFVRIRSYGFLANPCRVRELARCRALLGAKAGDSTARADADSDLVGVDAQRDGGRRCPECGKGWMECTDIVPPDTS